MTGVVAGLTKKDIEYMSNPENVFIYEFNLLWTSGDYWDRTPGNVEKRENKLRELYREFVIRHAVFGWSTAYLRIGELGLSKPEFNEIVKIIEENMKDQ